MAHYVLIHGAWHGGWCWREVAKTLRAAGHTVFTPSLTGNGESRHLGCERITLETHTRDVLGLIAAEELNEVILVGHSYGGMVITSAADRCAERIKRLVYLDAFVPTHGENLADCIRRNLPKEAADIFIGHFHQARDHDGLIPPIPGALFGQTPATTEWMERQCNAQSLATFQWPVLLSGAAAAIPRSYIVADHWQPSPFQAEAARYANAPGWTLDRLAGGHCLMMDSPAELSAVLARLA
ncbi:alpha/beta fold hydrolase [Nevskia sp.]|uniref:alpha/beta fold hydrolase n=1 Tax=Nevskia sp. TaxID=1929292 RepID=UPI003F6FA7C1